MTNSDWKNLLTIIEKDQLYFSERYPEDLKFSVIEQIGTNYFRNHDLLNAKKYFNLLPSNFFIDKYLSSNFIINFSSTKEKIIKKFNKKTVLKKTRFSPDDKTDDPWLGGGRPGGGGQGVRPRLRLGFPELGKVVVTCQLHFTGAKK